MNNDSSYVESIEELKSAFINNRLVPLTGTGISMSVGAPSWGEYLDKLMKLLPADDPFSTYKFESGNYLDLAETIVERLRILGIDPPGVVLTGTGTIHSRLAGWGLSLYLTTNYDSGLERAIGGAQVVTSDQLFLVNLQSNILMNKQQPQVVKLMTKAEELSRNSGTLTTSEYARLLYREIEPVEFLVTVLRTRTVLFVGCGMRDPFILAALQRRNVQRVGTIQPHYAIMPSNTDLALLNSLKKQNVKVIPVNHNDLTTEIDGILARIGVQRCNGSVLLIFEPGSPEKHSLIISALERLEQQKPDSYPSKVIVITANADLFTKITPSDRLLPIRVNDLRESENIVKLVEANLPGYSTRDENIKMICPYEFAVGSAAQFAEAWAYNRSPISYGVSPDIAETSRNKIKFATAIRQSVKNSGNNSIGIQPIAFEKISIDPNGHKPSMLFDDVAAWAKSNRFKEIILKPVDAAASIAVRPICFEKSVQSQISVVQEMLQIVNEMGTVDETRNCDSTKVLVQERIRGEEFSVESVINEGSRTTLAIHWKVDIDADDKRFFERLFVTLPPDLPEYQQLDVANNFLISNLYHSVKLGVLHSEYRIDSKGVRPIEIALRPGGGMVSESVANHHGGKCSTFDALVQLSLRAWEDPTIHSPRHVISTGLIFANSQKSTNDQNPGVLGLIEVLTSSDNVTYHWVPIRAGDPSLLRELLCKRLRSINRLQVKDEYLTPVLSNQMELMTTKVLRQRCLNAFNANGTGLNVELDIPRIWIQPGDWIQDEEASYVGGLLIHAQAPLRGDQAMAEAIAAMQVCLMSIKCEVHRTVDILNTTLPTQPASQVAKEWSTLRPGTFIDDEDSVTFRRAVDLALPKNSISPIILIDLGCGSARPMLRLLDKDHINYIGIDIKSANVHAAKLNLKELDQNSSRHLVYQDDIESDNFLHILSNHLSNYVDISQIIVAANLPYLPTTPDGPQLDPEVNGGTDGMKYIPNRVLSIANEVKATTCVINFSSLCDVRKILQSIDVSKWQAIGGVATCAPLGSSSKIIRQRIENIQVHSKSSDYVRLFGSIDNRKQCIYSLVLRRDGTGIHPATLLARLTKVLDPDSRPVGISAVVRIR